MKTPEQFIEEIWQHAPNGMNKRKLADEIREREKEQAVEFGIHLTRQFYDLVSNEDIETEYDQVFFIAWY